MMWSSIQFAEDAFKDSEYFEVYQSEDGKICIRGKKRKETYEPIENRFEILDL